MAGKTKAIDTTKLRIRSGDLRDLGDIQELNHRMCIKEHREYDETINKDYPIQPMGKAYFRGKILGKDSCSLVATYENKTVGYLVGSITAPEDYRTVGRMAELENMFVLDEHRSLGIGKRLVDTFIDWCKSKDVEIIKAVATAQNIRAIEFYQREGMEQKAVILEKRLKPRV
jgi:GNAT superfamily N-acetyltransferase